MYSIVHEAYKSTTFLCGSVVSQTGPVQFLSPVRPGHGADQMYAEAFLVLYCH